MLYVAGVDWKKQALACLENMGSADDVLAMPLCRFIAIHSEPAGVTKIRSAEDMLAARRRKKAEG
jgi:hypothetical protein